MTRAGGRWMPALTVLAALGGFDSSHAQELRRDVVSNGVLIGAGSGAAAGVVLSLATEEICSPGACAYLGGLAGGFIGLLVDKKMGDVRPVVPGSFVDDRLGNGALIGAASGVGIALLEASVRCRPGPERPPCTRNGVLLGMFRSAQWMAIVGTLVDAAIPSRVPEPSGALPAPSRVRSQRRFSVSFTVRY